MAKPFMMVIRLRRQEEKEERKLQRRTLRDLCNPFEFADAEFQKLFRANKDIAQYLCNELAEELQPGNNGPVHIKVLTYLRLIAVGSYQRGSGQDLAVCIAQTTLSKYLGQFTQAVIKVLQPQWVKFPGTQPLKRAIANEFNQKFGVDHVLGAVDCTHIAIFSPEKPQSAQYKNRKCFHSLNCQLVVDADCRILNVVARFPGRVHDQYIFSNSNLKQEFVQLYQRRYEYFLLGQC